MFKAERENPETGARSAVDEFWAARAAEALAAGGAVAVRVADMPGGAFAYPSRELDGVQLRLDGAGDEMRLTVVPRR